MTDIKTLVERMKMTNQFQPNADVSTAEVVAAIEALQGEVERMKAYAAHERSLAAEKYTQTIHDQKQEIASLQASLMELEKQEPVGFVQHLNELNDKWLQKLPIGAPLFAAPKALEPLTDEQKQRIHDETGAGHSLICLVESYVHGITKGTP